MGRPRKIKEELEAALQFIPQENDRPQEKMNDVAFSIFIGVEGASLNSDPITGYPRINNDGYGIVSDVSIKRKIRNILQAEGASIFVQSEELSDDGYTSLEARAKANEGLMSWIGQSKKTAYKIACAKWLDIRLFGQVLAVKGDKSLTMSIKGCTSFTRGKSLDRISISEMAVTKSVNTADVSSWASDRMGSKKLVDFGLYRINGFISGLLAERNGVSKEDYEALKNAIVKMFILDGSEARPAGSVYVAEFDWLENEGGGRGSYSARDLYSSITVERKVDVPKCVEDYVINVKPLEGVKTERVVKLQS